jgi:hypothetical protein
LGKGGQTQARGGRPRRVAAAIDPGCGCEEARRRRRRRGRRGRPRRVDTPDTLHSHATGACCVGVEVVALWEWGGRRDSAVTVAGRVALAVAVRAFWLAVLSRPPADRSTHQEGKGAATEAAARAARTGRAGGVVTRSAHKHCMGKWEDERKHKAQGQSLTLISVSLLFLSPP